MASDICSECNIIFFFSSRRRHTRSKRDWSSDVCSSDLQASARTSRPDPMMAPSDTAGGGGPRPSRDRADSRSSVSAKRSDAATARTAPKIGRASCRERGEDEEGGGYVDKKLEHVVG